MLPSTKPVVAVCAVRTGSGKSQTTRHVCDVLLKMGKKVVAVRHPMPYGDLVKQAVQRFATYADLDAHDCTIEEREEYEPHIDRGVIVYAGVDYEAILREAEKEADVVVWDGGNNDTPLLQARFVDHGGRPAPPGARNSLLSRRDEPARGRCDRAEQDRHGRLCECPHCAASMPVRSIPVRSLSRRLRRYSSKIRRRFAASACWWWRTAPR